MQVDLILDGDEVVLDEYGGNGEWSLQYTTVKKTLIYHDIYPGIPFPKVTFSLYLKRKPGYYGLNILTPCFMIIILGKGHIIYYRTKGHLICYDVLATSYKGSFMPFFFVIFHFLIDF